MPADQNADYGRNLNRRGGPALYAGPGEELHLSVITVQRAYEDLTRDGFIETVSGKGSFVAAQNQEFIREERLREAEGLLQRAAELGRSHGIPLEKLTGILTLFYEEGD